MKFKRFTKTRFLREVGRPLLVQLFGRFGAELAANQVTLPLADGGDSEWFQAVTGLAMRPDGLPDGLVETLFAIEELANPEGQERLEALVARAGVEVKFVGNSTPGDLAVQVWLAQPQLLVQAHNELRLGRLVAFEYFGSKRPADRSERMAPPDASVLDLLAADLDAWCRAHHRGEQTVRVEAYPLDGEFWFLVRHGDTYARTVKVEGQKIELLHFRPAKDDVVVYSPTRDELRIHAGTKGERELHRTAFGRRLFGDADYFSERKAYTLEPMRSLGVDALDVAGIEGLSRVVLTEYEVAFDTGHDEVLIRKADDLFAAAAESPLDREALPRRGRLVRAVFAFYFGNCAKPRKVEVRPPNTLKLRRHADARLVQRWLSEREFRVNLNPAVANKGARDGKALARA